MNIKKMISKSVFEMQNKTKSFFSFPSPVDLGKSTYNALPLRMFDRFDKSYSWEDYDEDIKKLHPIKYFILKTFPQLWKKKVWWKLTIPLSKLWYWIQCHLFFSRRYHLLDLRQPKGDCDGYRFGWIESDRQMLYACFNILKNFKEKELPNSYVKQEWTKKELKEEPGAKQWHDLYKEADKLYLYWTKEREVWYNKIHNLYLETQTAETESVYKKKQKAWLKEQDKFDAFEQEALIRLIKIRKGLWT